MSPGLLLVGGFLVGKVLGYYVGMRNARAAERDRCIGLLNQALTRKDGRNSWSVRWVMHAMLEDLPELMPASEFGLPPLEEKPAPDTIYCMGCGDGMEPDPAPELCTGCVTEALQRGVDPDPLQLRLARLEQDVHLCLWSSQPDILIACDHSWTTPAWGKRTEEEQRRFTEGIYKADDQRFYTFNEERATCQACRKIAADPVKRKAAGTP